MYNKKMAIVIYNKDIYKDTAMFVIRQEVDTPKITIKKNLVFFEDSKGICSLNVLDASKHFKSKEGYHTLSKEQMEFLEKNNIKKEIDFFTVGEIISREKHPTSDKLFLLKVDVKTAQLQIVTNSLNSLKGEKIVVANIGAILPSGKYITHSKVMGVESQGMLCGAKTLCIKSEQTEGVLLLDKKETVGDEFKF